MYKKGPRESYPLHHEGGPKKEVADASQEHCVRAAVRGRVIGWR